VKILAWIGLSIIILLIIVIVLIQTPYVQNIAKGKAEKYLSRKLKTRVNIGHLSVVFFRSVELKNIYIEDRQKDTLLSAGLLRVDLRMWGLLHNDIDIRDLQVRDLTAKVKRQLPDTAFNFQFIADAFSGGPSPEPEKTASKPMKMELDKLVLDRIRLLYKDTVTGNDMEVWIGHSETDMKEFDPIHLRFNVTKFQLSGLQAKVYQTRPLRNPTPAVAPAAAPPVASAASAPASSASVPASSSASAPFQLQLGSIDVENSHLDYRNFAGALFADLQLGHLSAVVAHFDLNEENIRLNELVLDSTTAALRMGKVASVVRGPKSPAPHTPSWQFSVATLRLNGNNIQFDDDNQRRQKAGMDYAHLKINQLTLHGSSLSYSGDSASGRLTKGSFSEQSGFRLTQLKTDFLYASHRAFLKNLLLQTPGTLLQRTAVLKYSSLAGMIKDPAHTLIDLDLPNSRIQVKDILTFMPALHTQPVFAHPEAIWNLNARLKGNLDALRIQTLQFSGIRDLHLDVAGVLLHPLDEKRIKANMTIRQLSGSREALVSLLPAGTLPSNISIPAHFDLRGKIDGGLQGFQSDLVLNTSSGAVLLKGYVRQFRQPKQASYDLVLQTRALDLGYILQDSAQYGRLSSGFVVKGQGLDLNSAHSSIRGRIESMTFRHYDYQELSLDGAIADHKATLDAGIQNTAIRFKLQASADLAHKFPALNLDWQIDTLDLHALHLVKDTLQFKGHILAGFADTNPDSLQGKLQLANLVVVQGLQRFATDSIILLASRKEEIEDIQVHSEMADLDWNGRYKITELPQALRHTISQYYRLDATGPASGDTAYAAHTANGPKSTAGAMIPRDTSFSAQDWTLQLHLRPSPLVLAFMPSLKGTDTVGAAITYNSGRNDLHLALDAPHIRVGNQDLQQVKLRAATDGGQLKYAINTSAGSGSGFELHETTLSGYLQQDHLFTDLLLKDGKGKDRYRVAGRLDKGKNGLKFMLNPDSLLLNYDGWQVSRDNYLQYDSSGILVHDFTISHAGESMSVNSNAVAPNSPIDIRWANFRLNTISRFFAQDSLSVDGSLNGTVRVKNVLTNPVFTSDLLIKDLSYKKDTTGDLAIKVNNETANAFAADISLEGKRNDIKIKGEYFTGDSKMNTGGSKMNMTLNLGQVDLGSFSHAAAAQVESMKGYLKGQLAITGSPDQPQVKGYLHFDSARITPVVSGEPLVISNDKIEFDADGFNFSQFTLLDSAGNKLTIDGNVYTHTYRDYKFDITVNANNFRLVNAPESSSRQFYGSLNLDAAANLTGAMDNLKVDGDIKVNKRTNFYFVLPGSDPEIVDRQGVVRFIDRNHPGDTLVDNAALALKARNTTIKGMDIAINIQTDSNAVFTIVIDERTGDALNVRGRSNLVFGMDKSGKTDLTGSYEVESGAYNLSLDVLKRKFAIQRGSSITWTGDPTTATLDLTANYTANTPSIDLIANEVASRPANDVVKFKQKLPFLVTLKMEGQLLKPKITFDITLPSNVLSLWPDVDAKLQQIRTEESELDKQVFALLLLNRFVGEDPLQSKAGGGSTLGNMAFQSASQILTNQLDNLAASLIKGVNIHFDLNNQQDFSTGTEQDYTELNVSVSKTLFNDRITVNVGSDFDVQGNNNPGQNASNFAGDVAVDYKLSKDGRYMVRAYRKNQYEAVVEGQVVETGVSFILTFDYNRLRELFGRTKEEKLQERIRQKPSGTGPAPATTVPTSTGKPATTTAPTTTGKPSKQ
jgi:hypothetical protein